MIIQGYAIYALGTGSLAWPFVWPKGALLYLCVCLLYLLAYCIINWALTWELVRKTHLEADQIAGRQIQQTLQPETLGKLPGYEVEAFYEPFREVGGDYFDLIELPDNKVLFAFAMYLEKEWPQPYWRQTYKLWFAPSQMTQRIPCRLPGKSTST
ncbi:MAG: hypothetical protein M3Y72_18630 [Acidobacteriota bacterium]|nr:hypothetical protein [Acidobacteriota bacterium]